ncbi:AAC(3) family N-acetyltransferase [Allosphingosinicella indica]|uniref:Aminoglycoside N(3)-acetyltransferase n=1 Tax=Allosphingosinicella indica TaxID=941907 RepID=A0A1X7G085_9SPHN|nr:AAC(3) family N-acetyltransferase [Allosphingosinicella indica]SMF61774.1 aminoglycoside 3-N-acetyltransferase [Allosphingosinicella indica]
MAEPFSIAAVSDQLRILGVRAGGILLVHTGFRAVRPIEGGIDGFIAALRAALGPEGTLVLPSAGNDDDRPFDAAATPADPGLGAVPEHFRSMRGVLRGEDYSAYAAIGPRAAEIVGTRWTVPPSAPGSAIDVMRKLGAQVALIGCKHDANTMLHLAELIGGAPYRVPRHFTLLDGGMLRRVDYGENDHCCEGFDAMDGWLRGQGLQAEGPVGHAHARLFDAADAVRIGAAKVAADPLIFLHPPGTGCEECDEARASVF